MVSVIKTGGDTPMPHSSEVIFHTHLLGGKQPHELTVLWARHCSFKINFQCMLFMGLGHFRINQIFNRDIGLNIPG
jgi:hypothetical protein